jgi:PHP family Zn ribbon phosphoesterase
MTALLFKKFILEQMRQESLSSQDVVKHSAFEQEVFNMLETFCNKFVTRIDILLDTKEANLLSIKHVNENSKVS